MENKAKDKAEELMKQFEFVYIPNYTSNFEVKQCALICVEEIIKAEPRTPSSVDWDDCGDTHKYYYEEQRKDALCFWEEVRNELNKLK